MDLVMYIALILGGLLVSSLVAYAVQLWQRQNGELRNLRRQKERAEQQEKEAAEAASLERVLRSLAALEALPALIEGMQAMCREMGRGTDTLLKAIEMLQACFDGSREHADDDIAPEQIAADQREVRSLVRRGIPEEEAESRVREKRLYESMRIGGR